MGDKLECAISLGIVQVGIGTSAEKKMDDIEVTLSGCPVEGCRLEFTTHRVDFSAIIKQPPAHADMSIDSGPM